MVRVMQNGSVEMNRLRTLLLSLDSGPERFPIKSRSVINSIQAHSWSTEVPLSCQMSKMKDNLEAASAGIELV